MRVRSERPVMVLRGAGDEAFSAGADISEFERVRSTLDQQAEYDRAVRTANTALSSCSKPTVAALRGHCLGGGLGLALHCDLRLADTTAHFAIPAARLGIGYDPHDVLRLTRVVGDSRARDILFTGRQIDAEEALAIGLVDRVAPPNAFDGLLADYLDRIANNAPLTIRAAKLAVQAAGGKPASLEAATRAAQACAASDDYREGRRAFMAKRKPAFQGR